MNNGNTPVHAGTSIVVLDRGWVYVGDVTLAGDFAIIENARNVRRWGTTKGLGELAAKGPQRNTQLDPAGTVRAPMRAVIALIDCDRVAWASDAKASATADVA
jgi:hypothetical protein